MQNRDEQPLMTWMLCAICVLITVANNSSTTGSGDLWSHIGHCTDSTPDDIWNGKYYYLVSNIFLHSKFTSGLGITHLLFNMIWLFRMGGALEVSIGTLNYFIFWVVAAIVSMCAELAVTGAAGIGASGVVYAIFGILWAGRGRYPEWGVWANNRNIQLFVGWGIFCFVMTQMRLMQVANFAHAGGLAFGYAVGALFFIPRQRWFGAAGLAALMALSILSVTFLPWSQNWTFWKASKEYDAQNYHQSIYWFHKNLKDGDSPDPAWNNIALCWSKLAELDVNRGDIKHATFDEDEAEAAIQHKDL